MAAKEPNPAIEEILEVAKDSLLIVKNPNGLGNDTWRVYSNCENAALLDTEDELKGFEKSLKMQKITARLAEIASDDWDISWAWSLQAEVDTLAGFLKSAKKLEMDIALTDTVIGELTEEDLPRVKNSSSRTIGDGLVSVGGVGPGSGIWSGNLEEFEKLAKGMGIPGFGNVDEYVEATKPKGPTSDELIKSLEDGTYTGDPVEALWEIGKALAEEGADEEDEENV